METAEVVEEVGVVVRLKPKPLRVPNTQIYLQENGQAVKCTENSDEVHIFVENLLHAHGRMSTLHVLLNEILTSLAAPKMHQFMTHCIITRRS